MRLHRVQLRNYRGVVKSDVSFSQNGVTIVEGPNEVGKTAISEGLQLAIDLPDSSKSAQVQAVQPVGRDEGPEVEISTVVWQLRTRLPQALAAPASNHT